jgi:cytochrome oxidase Cu insertion factor (SCO1/SenC/PrrC family)
MRCVFILGVVAALGLFPADVQAQKSRKKDEDFVKARPAVGDPLPDETVLTPDGKEFKTASLRGHYTVLTFGCLT